MHTHQFRSLGELLETDVLNEYTLRILGENASHQLDLAPILIGRDPRCDLVISSRSVSRFHCVIYRAGKQTLIRDLHSTNGVFLNQVKVSSAPLRVGDKFQIGDLSYKVVIGPPRQQKYQPECVVMFMDIADSTRLSEEYGSAFAQFMHQQIARIEDEVFTLAGLPVKHLGDGLMCAFGIWPAAAPDYSAADAALSAGLQAIRHIQQLTRFPDLSLRVGMAYGEVSLRQQEGIDLFGDTVNLASRLEYSNKLYGTQLMLSESFFNQLQQRASLREVDTVRVKGKNQPIRIFSWDERLSSSRQFLYTGFYHMGLEAYRKGDFQLARGFFERGVAEKDPLSLCMRERVEQLLVKPPLQWDGIWNLEKE